MAHEIRMADLDDPQVVALFQHHQSTASAQTAAGSAHALKVAQLRGPDLAFWTLWSEDLLLACGGLKELSPEEGEVKAMHTVVTARGQGAGSGMLSHIVSTARQRGYRRLSLETGSWPYFEDARRLYANHGFQLTGPFGGYEDDPNSVFMTLDLSQR